MKLKKICLTLFLIIISTAIIILNSCTDDDTKEPDMDSGTDTSVNIDIDKGTDADTEEPDEDTDDSAVVRSVLDKITDVSPLTLSLDKSVTYQTIEGFGFAHGIDSTDNNWTNRVIDELGLSMWRLDIASNIPADYNWNERRDNAIALKEKADASGVPLKVILTVWSPPGEFKVQIPEDSNSYSLDQLNAERNKKIPHLIPENGGTLNPDMYSDYADWLISALDMYKFIGIDIYALSLQNEPGFRQSYGSCVYTAEWYVELLNNVVPLVKQSYPDIIIFGSECMLDFQAPDQSWWDKFLYNREIAGNPEALDNLDRFATHGYLDGVQATAPGSHKKLWEQEKTKYGMKPNWMTETSGYVDDWDPENGKSGALELAVGIQAALRYGDVAAWLWWSGAEPESPNENHEAFMYGHGKTGKKFEVSKQFYRFIRPDSVRIDGVLSDEDTGLIVTAYQNKELDNTVIVFVNNDDINYSVNITGQGIPELYNYYITTGEKNIDCKLLKDAGGEIIIPAKSVVTLVNGSYKEDAPGPLSTEIKNNKDVTTSGTILENANFEISGVYASNENAAKKEAANLVSQKVLTGVKFEIDTVSYQSPESDSDGSYIFTVKLSKGELESVTGEFFMRIIPVELKGAELNIDDKTTYQTIDGFGFIGVDGGKDWVDLVVNDLGLSLWHNFIDPKDSWESQKVKIKELADETKNRTGSPLRAALTVLSPPVEMKVDAGDYWFGLGSDRTAPWDSLSKGTLDPEKYEEFSDWLIGTIRQYREIGVEVYALCLQYEPIFDHDFQSSANYMPLWYTELLKNTVPKIKEKYPEIKIVGPSAPLMFELAFDWNPCRYLEIILRDDEALENIDIFSSNSTGNKVDWGRFNDSFTSQAEGKTNWMSKEQGYNDSWISTDRGAIELAADIQNDLIYGNVAGWLYHGSGEFIPLDLKTGNLYSVLKHFYKFIRPGAIRLDASVNQSDLAVSVFKNPDGSIVIELVNPKGSDYAVNINASGLPDKYNYYITTASDVDNCRYDNTVDINDAVIVPAASVVTLVSVD